MNDFDLVDFPENRISTIDAYELGRKGHHVKGLLEIDVTAARILLKEMKEQQNLHVTFTAWLVRCIIAAVSEYRESAGYLKNRHAMLVFHDIDFAITVEKDINGRKVPMPYVIRHAETKSILEIHREIQKAKEEAVDGRKVMLGRQYNDLARRFFFGLPGFLRRFVWRKFILKPQNAKKLMGNVMLTSVGMFGAVDGWFIPTTIHPLYFSVGAIIRKPGVVKDEVVIREYLKLTVLINHDVMDGAPAVRFLARLDQLMQSAFGLDASRNCVLG